MSGHGIYKASRVSLRVRGSVAEAKKYLKNELLKLLCSIVA